MPPDRAGPDAASAARAVHARWCELRDLYDVLDHHLAIEAWASAAALAPRIDAVAAGLATLAATTTETRRTTDAVLWAQTDAIVTALAERQARALRIVAGARDAVATDLARMHVTRGHAARYGDGPRASLFSSRVV